MGARMAKWSVHVMHDMCTCIACMTCTNLTSHHCINCALCSAPLHIQLRLALPCSQLLVIGMKPNEPCAPWRFRLLRPWLQFWTGVFLTLGLGFWTARVKGWEHYQEAQEAR